MNSDKMLAAARHNLVLNSAGLILSLGCSILLVRALGPRLYAEYAAALAMVALLTLVFGLGGTTGLTRYMTEARQHQARGTFYRLIRRRRVVISLALTALLLGLGPYYARTTEFSELAHSPWLFLIIAGIVTASLIRVLAYAGLLSLFEHKTALLTQHVCLILKSVLLAGAAVAGVKLLGLLALLMVLGVIEAVAFNRILWSFISGETEPIESTIITKAQKFGVFTIIDKFCATMGGGPMLLLFLAPIHSAHEIAFLALGSDLVAKVVSLTIMPMGNLIAPYLSGVSSDPAAQSRAAGRVAKFSSLLLTFAAGGGVLTVPYLIPLIYGKQFASAVIYTILLLVPACFENWVRGFCSTALLRNAYYREILILNGVQAIATLSTLYIVRHQSMSIILVAVGVVRCVTSSIALVYMRHIVDRQVYFVPLRAATIMTIACLGAYSGAKFSPNALAWDLLVTATVYLSIYIVGLCHLIVRDRELLNVAQRLVGLKASFAQR